MERAGVAEGDDEPVTTPGRDPGRPARRRRRVVVGGLVAVAGLLVAGLLVPTSVFDGIAARSVSRLGGDCADLVGVDVHSGSWPVAGRLMAGHYEGVSADIDEVRLRDPALTYHDVTFTAARIDIGKLGGLFSDEVRIHRGTTTATLGFDALESVLGSYGVTAELSGEAGSIRAEIVLPPFGEVPTTVDVTAVDGGIDLQFVALDLVTLPPLRIGVPAPAAVRSVEVRHDGVHVDATIDGFLPTDDFSCEL
jgi:hypothetical protein